MFKMTEMKYRKRDIIERMQTIACQHQHYAQSMLCPAAEYLRQEWELWAKVLRKEYPGEMLPTAHWHIANQ